MRLLLAGQVVPRRARVAAVASQAPFVALALAVLALTVALHATRLEYSPGWDPQEGYNLDIAWNLLHGQARIFALTSAFAQHPPLYFALLGLAIRVFGYGIVAARALAALYAVLTCAVVLGVGWRLAGARAALLAGVVFTVAPLMLANTRWAYSYGQVMLLGMLCLAATWRFTRDGSTRWLVIAALLAGVAAASDYVGVAWVVFVAVVAARRAWRAGLVAALLGGAVLLASLLLCLLLFPSAFLTDLADTFLRAGGGNPLLQVVEALVNYYRFLVYDPVVPLGLVGLCLVPPRARGLLLGAFVTLSIVTLKVRPLGPSFHTAVQLLPLLALGAGALLDRALTLLYAWALPAARGALRSLWAGARPALSERLARGFAVLVLFVVVFAPLGIALASDAAGLAGTTLASRQDAYLGSATEAQAVAAYIYGHARPGDLVLASSTVAWLFDAPPDASGQRRDLRGADILQAPARAGRSAAFYAPHLPASRWVYPVNTAQARYVVVDALVRALAAADGQDGLRALLAEVSTWPVAYSRGQYTVYERPGSAVR